MLHDIDMTKEEALALLKTFRITGDREHTTFGMAIRAFENQVEQEKADGCQGCMYIDRDGYDEPCRNCKNSKMLLWRRAK